MRLFPEVLAFPQDGLPFPIHAYDVRWVLRDFVGRDLIEGPWLDFGSYRPDEFAKSATPKVTFERVEQEVPWTFVEIQMRRGCAVLRAGVFHRNDKPTLLAGVCVARNGRGEEVWTQGGLIVKTPALTYEFCRDGHVTARDDSDAEESGVPAILNPEHLQHGRI